VIVLWTNRILPRQFWILHHTVRINSESGYFGMGGGQNILFFSDFHLNKQRIVGPLNTDHSAVASFKRQFGNPVFHMNWYRFKTLSETVYAIDAMGEIGMTGIRTSYGIPYGYFLILFLVLPACRWLPSLFRSVRRRWVIPMGICKNCGYDLRATPDRCPECGSAPTATKS